MINPALPRLTGDVVGGCAQGVVQSSAIAEGTAAVTGGQVEISAGELAVSCVAEGAAKGFEEPRRSKESMQVSGLLGVSAAVVVGVIVFLVKYFGFRR